MSENGRRRVAVTGMGLVTPIGVGVESTWKSLVGGRSGGGELTSFDSAAFSVHIAAEADEFEPRDYLDAREIRRSDRFCHMAVAASAMAVEHAGWSTLPYEPHRIAVVVGSGIGGLSVIETSEATLLSRGPGKVGGLVIPMLMINAAAGAIGLRWGITGPNFAPVSACATGAHSIGEAALRIRAGAVHAAIAGGAEAAITPLAMAAFANMGALSKRNDHPEHASRPFDAGRDGFVMGEGSGIVVLEDWDSAVARGATIHGEIAGYGASCDAFHLTAPDPEGTGQALAMRMAVEDAGIELSAIGYINAHGTSTPLNDKTESLAVRSLFGDAAPPMSSTKGATGHLLGAAGAIEAIFSMLALRDGKLPPTINYESPDPECPLDYIPNTARAAGAEYALSNSFGFGGHNACLVLRRVA